MNRELRSALEIIGIVFVVIVAAPAILILGIIGYLLPE
jgi:hypothetical protein